MEAKPRLPNPLDSIFETAQDTPEVDENEYVHVSEGQLATIEQGDQPVVERDEDDIATDEKIDKVYDAAIDTFQRQMDYADIIEPRYAARNAEVAASYLNIALNAAATKARVKNDRKRSQQFVPYNNRPAGANVVASREEILRMLAVDGEVKDVK